MRYADDYDEIENFLYFKNEHADYLLDLFINATNTALTYTLSQIHKILHEKYHDSEKNFKIKKSSTDINSFLMTLCYFDILQENLNKKNYNILDIKKYNINSKTLLFLLHKNLSFKNYIRLLKINNVFE